MAELSAEMKATEPEGHPSTKDTQSIGDIQLCKGKLKAEEKPSYQARLSHGALWNTVAQKYGMEESRNPRTFQIAFITLNYSNHSILLNYDH